MSSFFPYVDIPFKSGGQKHPFHPSNVAVMVDAAHALGQLPNFRPASMGATYVVFNCHKWFCAPRGAAAMWVHPAAQAEVHPLNATHGMGAGFASEFIWDGGWAGGWGGLCIICVGVCVACVGVCIACVGMCIACVGVCIAWLQCIVCVEPYRMLVVPSTVNTNLYGHYRQPRLQCMACAVSYSTVLERDWSRSYGAPQPHPPTGGSCNAL